MIMKKKLRTLLFQAKLYRNCLSIRKLRFKGLQIVGGDPFHTFLYGGRAIRQDIQQAEMQHNIPIGKALGYEGDIQRVAGKRPAVNGDKNLLAVPVVIGIDIAYSLPARP